MIDTEAVRQQVVLRQYHVVIVVSRKVRVQTIARLARPSVADVVGKDDEVAVGVKKLAGPKQNVSKLRGQELAA